MVSVSNYKGTNKNQCRTQPSQGIFPMKEMLNCVYISMSGPFILVQRRLLFSDKKTHLVTKMSKLDLAQDLHRVKGSYCIKQMLSFFFFEIFFFLDCVICGATSMYALYFSEHSTFNSNEMKVKIFAVSGTA